MTDIFHYLKTWVLLDDTNIYVLGWRIWITIRVVGLLVRSDRRDHR